MGISAVMMSAAGAAKGVVSSYYGAKSQKSSLQFQAGLDDINARLAETSAQTALMQGQREEQRSDLQTAAIKSTQTANFAASGVDIGEGSAADVLTSTDVMGAVDANTIHANAVRTAMGYRTQGTNYSNQALMSRAGASAINPTAAATSSLLDGATQVAASWYSLNKAGAFDKGSVSQADLTAANKSNDPLGALAKSKGWY